MSQISQTKSFTAIRMKLPVSISSINARTYSTVSSLNISRKMLTNTRTYAGPSYKIKLNLECYDIM